MSKYLDRPLRTLEQAIKEIAEAKAKNTPKPPEKYRSICRHCKVNYNPCPDCS